MNKIMEIAEFGRHIAKKHFDPFEYDWIQKEVRLVSVARINANQLYRISICKSEQNRTISEMETDHNVKRQ